jgi:tetratricopeptide (TPR) repeat protein
VKRLIEAAWSFQPDDFCDFVVRAASDFPGDVGLIALSDVPLSSAEARSRWGRLVADFVRVTNNSIERTACRLLAKLRELARTHPEEDQLRAAVARAELYLANILLFSERNYEQARAQFDIAIAVADSGTETEAAAINNRGILHHEVQDEDRAFRDWSEVIAKGGISNEARACSLNNRADIFARRGTHDAAIHDRSEVLTLTDTSPDRRYIALIRRSRSYLALGRTEEALRDLGSILSTDDIAVEQKAEALLTRGALYKDLGRLLEARHDLEMALAADDLFPGTSASTLVELAEVSRLERDPKRALEYLNMASGSIDVEPSTLVEALIVRARLLADDGDEAGAHSVWQGILANPNASVRQKEVAAARGATSVPPVSDERHEAGGREP